ncbi:MAG: hypothetical protein ACR2GU_03255 [Rubrobacteraceae bacterium]
MRVHWVTVLSALAVLVLSLCQNLTATTPLTTVAPANSPDLGICMTLSEAKVAPCGGVGAHPGMLLGPGFATTLIFALTALLCLHRNIAPTRRKTGSLGKIGCYNQLAALRFLRSPDFVFLQVLRL